MDDFPLTHAFEQATAGRPSEPVPSAAPCGKPDFNLQEVASVEEVASVDAERLERDACVLAGLFTQLRTQSECEPLPDHWDRFQARVALYLESGFPEGRHAWENLPPASPPREGGMASVSTTDLVDLCLDTLDPTEAGAVARRLAKCPSAQGAYRTAAQLAKCLKQLRQATEAPVPPDSLPRFQARALDDLDQQLSTAVTPPSASSSAIYTLEGSRSEGPRNEAGRSQIHHLPTPAFPTPGGSHRRARPRSRFGWGVVLAISAAVAGLMIGMPYFQGSPFGRVASEVRQVHSLAELRKLEPEAASLVGTGLLNLDQISPEEMSDRQLLHDLTLRSQRTAQLKTAQFLAAQSRQYRFRLVERPATSRSATAARSTVNPPEERGFSLRWNFESSARAQEPAVADPPSAAAEPPSAAAIVALKSTEETALRAAVAQQDYAAVITLTELQTDLRSRLLTVWALAELKQVDLVEARLATLEADAQRTPWPLSARVYLGGVYRTLGQPLSALRHLEVLLPEVPQLAFPIGYLYQHDLLNEKKATEFFRQLSTGDGTWSSYGEHGLAEVHVTTVLHEDFDGNYRGEPAQPERPLTLLPDHQGGHYLHWFEVRDLLTAREFTAGDASWRNYQISVDVRFDEPDRLGKEPRIGIVGYYASHEQNYRLAVGLEGLQFVRRDLSYSVSGGYDSTAWPRHEPRYSPDCAPAGQLEEGVWYRVKFRLENHINGTFLAAKIWPRSSPEPDGWTLLTTDTDPRHHAAGRVGLLVTDATASLDNLKVEYIAP